MPEDKKSGILSMIGGAIPAVAGAVLGMVNQRGQDRRQVEQQRKLQKLQIEGNKEMADYQQNLQMDMWNKTNYGAQVDHMKKAGINPALLYGMSGGGGATTGSGSGTSVNGGDAANAAATQGANTGMGLMIAQQRLLEAQTENVKADTAKKSGVDTAESQTRIDAGKWQNEINKIMGGDIVKQKAIATDKLENDWSKQLAEYNAWVTGGFAGKESTDPESPIAKAIRAGMEQKIEDLKGAKIKNDIREAEKIIKDFEAGLAKEGISPNTPWWAKIMGDFLTNMGMNPLTEIPKYINKQ